MKILAIDTSTTLASVSYSNNIETFSKSINNEVTHSEKLLTLVDELLKENNIKIKDIDLFASSSGPGSFTGIRIGIATIKAFAEIKDINIYARSSLDLIAYNHINKSKYICSMLDAKNSNVYYSLYYFSNNYLEYVIKPTFDSLSNCIKELSSQYSLKDILFVGNGTLPNIDLLNSFDKNIKVDITNPLPHSENLIKLAEAEYDMPNSKYLYNFKEFKPLYLRPSQAERNLK